ncbi:hypothetical protein ASC66_08115 [Leifsonia sp. Root4]|uniref:hypothetical protein n=1 Tax=Leifsonia sp. Root4 TaxID=1736525 RepID=UPI0006FFCF6F|nr:hypothetical protein [Leifsonia sp. Root4]KQW06442.1 hypothetical protein ASC66_08115 [Leifsonia sp. Root4]
MTRLDKLTETNGGRWRVRTRDSVHLFDLEAMTVTRVPGPSSEPSAYDAARPLLRIVECTAGEKGHWHTRADGTDAEHFDFIRHITSRILRICPAPLRGDARDSADDEG